MIVDTVLKKIFGSKYERDLKAAQPIVRLINSLEPTISKLSDEQLIAKTPEFKQRLAQPATFRGGVSGQPFSQWLMSADYVKRQDTEGEIDVGAEVTPRRFLSMRVGYRYALTRPDLGGLSDFSAGFGLRFKQMSLDYAFIPLGDLGLTHHLSFNLRFRPKRD